MRKAFKNRGEQAGEELAALAAKREEAIDTSDAPEIEDWSDAERGRFYRPVKRTVTIRLDADLLEWFKRREPKYQTAVNRVLREYMRSHR
jgi:uncharacterized protein (DUF4415 family)